MDDWGADTEPEGRETGGQTEHLPFEFTAFYADLGFELDGVLRPPQFAKAAVSQRLPTDVVAQTRQMKIRGVSKTCVQLRQVQLGQQTLALTWERQRPQLSRCGRGFRFRVEPWLFHGITALVVRHLRRSGTLTEAELGRELRRWGVSARQRMQFRPGTHPQLFAEFPRGVWRLTPWTRLDVPFTGVGTAYVTDATRFWLEYRYVPTTQEEWHPEVRERVRVMLDALDVPPYFVEHRAGGFVQVTPYGRKTYRLDVDRLPEGRYFTLTSAQGDQTFSVEGRAFLLDTGQGVSNITPWTTLRLRNALLMAEDDVGICWHPAGLAFKASVRKCLLEVMRI